MAQGLPSTIAVDPDDPTRSVRRGRSRTRGGGSGNRSPLVVNFVLAVLVAAVAAAGWFILEQQDQLASNSQILVDANRRIGVLEERLRVTDEELLESGEDIVKQLAFWEDEIRKLWDIANKRNKRWIEENQANVDKLGRSIAAAVAAQQDLKSTVARLDGTANEQREIADRVNTLDMALNRLVQQQRDQVDKANAATQIASSLQSRVRENEQAIAAIDTHRARINADLAELRRLLATPR